MVQLLLVDDDRVQMTTRKLILEHAGFAITAMNDPEEALAWLEATAAPRVELVISDHMMPGMSGTEFVGRLRRRFPSLPVLVVSGLPNVEEQYAGLNVDVRMKPLAPNELIDTCRRLTAPAAA